MQDRTTILIAHRRSTLRLAQRIVVIDHGRVVAEGTHEHLLATNAGYRELFAGPGDDCEGTDVQHLDGRVAGRPVIGQRVVARRR